jgi:choline transporter-like protein 2/4/5
MQFKQYFYRNYKFIFSMSLNFFFFLSMQPDIPFLSVFSSTKRLMRYSLGSLALGSLTVSFVELIRFMLESIRRKLKVSSHVPDNWFGKAAYHLSQFFLRCIEWTVKSVNRNAYIMVNFIMR